MCRPVPDKSSWRTHVPKRPRNQPIDLYADNIAAMNPATLQLSLTAAGLEPEPADCIFGTVPAGDKSPTACHAVCRSSTRRRDAPGRDYIEIQASTEEG